MKDVEGYTLNSVQWGYIHDVSNIKIPPSQTDTLILPFKVRIFTWSASVQINGNLSWKKKRANPQYNSSV